MRKRKKERVGLRYETSISTQDLSSVSIIGRGDDKLVVVTRELLGNGGAGLAVRRM